MNNHYPIGTIYKDRKGRICKVVDILETFNSQKSLVKVRYVTSHSLMGQDVLDHDVLGVTIARALAEGKD